MRILPLDPVKPKLLSTTQSHSRTLDDLKHFIAVYKIAQSLVGYAGVLLKPFLKLQKPLLDPVASNFNVLQAALGSAAFEKALSLDRPDMEINWGQQVND